jgi:hypothetical protein
METISLISSLFIHRHTDTHTCALGKVVPVNISVHDEVPVAPARVVDHKPAILSNSIRRQPP